MSLKLQLLAVFIIPFLWISIPYYVIEESVSGVVDQQKLPVAGTGAGSMPELHSAHYDDKGIAAFLEQKGQITDQYGAVRKDIDFVFRSSGPDMFVSAGKLEYQWAQPDTLAGNTQLYRLDMVLVGADKEAAWVAEEEQDYTEHYYYPDGRAFHAASYRKIICKNIYPHIDWVLYVPGDNHLSAKNTDTRLKYDFVVRPGGRIADIRLQYKGAAGLGIQPDGSFGAETPVGSLTEHAPYSYQQDGKEVRSAFVFKDNMLGFDTDPYEGVLTIDPTLVWSTYYGGGSNDHGMALATDPGGYVYMAGYTASAGGIATTGGHQATISGAQNTNAFLVKFNVNGVRQWATYYGGTKTGGGTSQTYATSVTRAPNGDVYIGGYTNSNAGIASAALHQGSYGGGAHDAFIVKFNTGGVRLWANYYGGGGDDQGRAVRCDHTGNVYLAGQTTSDTLIATSGAYRTARGGSTDGFLVKFNAGGVRQWGTYYGAGGNDAFTALACDAAGAVYAAGYMIHNRPYPDGLLVKFNGLGAWQWEKRFNARDENYFWGVDYDQGRNVVYVAGEVRHILKKSDAVLLKYDTSGTLVRNTYLSGPESESGTSVVVNQANGDVYMAGCTGSSSGIAYNYTPQPTFGGVTDAFVAKYNSNLSRQWSGYLGKNNLDFGQGITFYPVQKAVFLCGYTNSGGMATPGSHKSLFMDPGLSEAYLARINDCDPLPTVIVGDSIVCYMGQKKFSVAPIPSGSYSWTLPPGWLGSSITNNIMVGANWNSSPGNLSVTVKNECNDSVVISKELKIYPDPPIQIQVNSSADSLYVNDDYDTIDWYCNGNWVSNSVKIQWPSWCAAKYKVVVSEKGCYSSDSIKRYFDPYPPSCLCN